MSEQRNVYIVSFGTTNYSCTDTLTQVIFTDDTLVN